MKTSILSLAVALMLGFSFSANAGTPEVKAAKAEAPSVKAHTSVDMYWYEVVYDASHPTGYIPANAALVVQGDQQAAENTDYCELGSSIDCLRGFLSPQISETSSAGDAQTKKD